MADFHDQQSAGAHERRRLAEYRSHGVQPILASRQRQLGLVSVFQRQLLHRQRGDVGWIADDEIVGLLGKVRQQVGTDEVDAVLEPVFGDVALRDGKRVGGNIGRIDVGLRKVMREQDREAPRTRAQVERVLHTVRVGYPRIERIGQQLGDERTRNDHPLIDIKAKCAEPGFVRQISRGNSLGDTALDQRLRVDSLRVRKLRVEKQVEAIGRKLERVLQQIRRLVVCAGRAVAEKQSRRRKARYRVAQPVAYGFELLNNVAHRWILLGLRSAQQALQYATIHRR